MFRMSTLPSDRAIRVCQNYTVRNLMYIRTQPIHVFCAQFLLSLAQTEVQRDRCVPLKDSNILIVLNSAAH